MCACLATRNLKAAVHRESGRQFSIWTTYMIKSKSIWSCSAVTVWRMFWRWILSSKIIVAMIFLSSPWCKAGYTKLLPANKLVTVFYDNNQRKQGWFKVTNLDKRWLLITITHQFFNHCFPQWALWRGIYKIFFQENNLLVIRLTDFVAALPLGIDLQELVF